MTETLQAGNVKHSVANHTRIMMQTLEICFTAVLLIAVINGVDTTWKFQHLTGERKPKAEECDTDHCASSPCNNNGTCTSGPTTFSCQCTDGYKGNTCNDTDHCASSPCNNNGTCTSGLTTFSCQCANGYRGNTCNDTDHCVSSPCNNNGTCTSGPTTFSCQCTDGYKGNTCNDTDHCASSPCNNNGTCTSGPTTFSCQCTNGYKGDTCEVKLPFNSCMEILQSDGNLKGKDGTYMINVGGPNGTVYCDMTTDGGGWTIIQKRQDGLTDFYRNWTDYKNGFGDPSKSYWIGNDAIHNLTTTNNQELRVDISTFDGEILYALYSSFEVGNETSKYKLNVSGYTGSAGNVLANGTMFTTFDQDNDESGYKSCAIAHHAAWWYSYCGYSSLNGKYGDPKSRHYEFAFWGFRYNLKRAIMMIRPKNN
ncbi:ficolin-2-like [Ostrea edulis]|uniref:ficolin-2-like n=1 Tax=Ostrea edulis TaxID=37623 RepID=UPI0024AEC3F3|nr:ficolin-2-like [Ostrea edulis]